MATNAARKSELLGMRKLVLSFVIMSIVIYKEERF